MADQISSLKGLLDLYGTLEKQEPKAQMRENPAAREALTKMNGLSLLQQRLQDIQNIKSKGGIGNNTGPFIGSWQGIGGFDATGNPEPPPMTSRIANMIMPNAAKQRTTLQQALNQANAVGFDTGGKQLTGGEKSITASGIPSMYQDDDSFNQTLDRSIKTEIPRSIQSQAKLLLDMGYDEATVRQIMQDSIK